MKKMIAIGFMALVSTASAQWENQSQGFQRWPQRIVQGRRYDLAKLSPWWSNAARLMARQQNVLTRADDLRRLGHEPIDEIPPRPITNWCRVLGTNFHAHRLGWLVEGEIEESPGQRRAARFILEHPPIQDKDQFEADRSEWKALIAGGHVNIATTMKQDIQGNSWWEGTGTQIAGTPVFLTGLNQAEMQRAADVSGRMAFMPPGDEYRLDFFAIKIGYLPDASHLEVWDLGLPPGTVGN
jgi:hypothetical protein